MDWFKRLSPEQREFREEVAERGVWVLLIVLVATGILGASLGQWETSVSLAMGFFLALPVMLRPSTRTRDETQLTQVYIWTSVAALLVGAGLLAWGPGHDLVEVRAALLGVMYSAAVVLATEVLFLKTSKTPDTETPGSDQDLS